MYSPGPSTEELELLGLRRKVVDSIHKNKDDSVPKERVLTFMRGMMNVLFRYVKDPRDRAAMLGDVRALAGGHTDTLAMPATVDVTAEPSEAEPA